MSGRPTKLDVEMARKLTELIRAGSHAVTAAAACGINRATYFRWMNRGEQQNRGPYRDFHDGIKRAEAECELRCLMHINKAALADWRANAWLLERKWPARYGPQIRVTVEKTLNDMLEALKRNLDAETFVRVVKVLSQHGEQSQLEFEPEAAETVLLNPERDA